MERAAIFYNAQVMKVNPVFPAVLVEEQNLLLDKRGIRFVHNTR